MHRRLAPRLENSHPVWLRPLHLAPPRRRPAHQLQQFPSPSPLPKRRQSRRGNTGAPRRINRGGPAMIAIRPGHRGRLVPACSRRRRSSTSPSPLPSVFPPAVFLFWGSAHVPPRPRHAHEKTAAVPSERAVGKLERQEHRIGGRKHDQERNLNKKKKKKRYPPHLTPMQTHTPYRPLCCTARSSTHHTYIHTYIHTYSPPAIQPSPVPELEWKESAEWVCIVWVRRPLHPSPPSPLSPLPSPPPPPTADSPPSLSPSLHTYLPYIRPNRTCSRSRLRAHFVLHCAYIDSVCMLSHRGNPAVVICRGDK